MEKDVTRRRLLGAGATIGMGSIAGCSGSDDAGTATGSDDTTSAEPTAGTTEQAETTTQEPVADGSGLLPAAYVVTKEDGEIRAYNGQTLEVEFSGAAGGEDGRVLQATFDAMASGRVTGGRVFIRRAEYTPDRQLSVSSSHTEVRSDFAWLTFQDHPRDDGESQADFTVESRDGTTEHVEVRGLVLDANKDARTARTRTADVRADTRHVTFRDCVIFGGKSVDGDGGYGIGEDDDADYVTIENCVVRDSDRHGYHTSAPHVRIVDSTFLNNAKETGDVFDLAATDAVVANNHFEGNGHGIKIDDSDAEGGRIVVTGNVFVDNYLPDVASGQIEFADTTVDSVHVSDNTFVLPDIDATETSAHVLFDSDESLGSVRVRNNHFEGGGPQALTWFTETGRRLRTLVVEHNTFERVPNDVGLLASAERLLVRDNLFACSGDRGRLEVKECSAGVVTGNVTDGAGIDVQSDLVVERNYEL
ncbi:right-handed parallel beta-helix repeat-containing protein [Haloarchaeobius iranensis]|uniref:Right handed beta helix region n=1 Tax=Haloarchaeobius iranensis TaxID=996166 RepID=A0A1G9UVK7_9EURY|nr:right-handed parallel beta-helix repeat-containing protein [Haloarchaeobius iranensis]SDM63847.1 Right handed beta helix region [Haloarchaeobius iranensis]